MPTLITEEVMEQYVALTRKFRRLIPAVIRAKEYEHLCVPNKKRKRHVPVSEMQARVRILTRPSGMEKTGSRNLNLGRLEVMLVYQGELANPSDYREGLLYEQLRYAIGGDLSYADPSSMGFLDWFQGFLNIERVELNNMLYDGIYLRATEIILDNAEKAMQAMKESMR